MESRNIKGVQNLTSVEVIDIQGRTVLSINDNLNVIDISALSSGSYLVKITSNNTSVIKKLIVE